MSSRPEGRDYPNNEKSRSREKLYQHANTTQISHGQSPAPAGPSPASRASTAMAPSYPDNDTRRYEQHRPTPTRGANTYSISSDASLHSTRASTGASSPPPAASAPSARATHDHTAPSSSHWPSRGTQPASSRPSISPVAPPVVRPSLGPDGQYRSVQMPPPRGTSQDVDRYGAPAQQQSLFASPHGIREPAAPRSTRARPVSMVVTPTFTSNPTFPAYMDPSSSSSRAAAPQMPGAFPGDIAVPYRRPTDLSAQLSSWSSNELNNEGHFLSNSEETWDSEEGDSGSNLSTSTSATTVGSDITVGGKEEAAGYTSPGYGGGPLTSSGAITPTQDYYDDTSDQSRHAHRVHHAPVLRRAGHKTVLPPGNKMISSSSSSKAVSSSNYKPTKSASSGSGSGSLPTTRRNSQSGGAPHIHIELHKPRESHSDAKIQQKIEKVLRDHLNQVEQRKVVEAKEPPVSSASAAQPAKSCLSVRFAEPGTQPKPAAAPLPLAETTGHSLTKELVLQGKEIHKLELEVEKRDQLIKEKEKAELERQLQAERAQTELKKHQERVAMEKKLQDERAQLEREKQHERERQNLEMQKREMQKTQKAEEQKRELERQQHEREKKEAEKAQKAKEKERAKERQRIDKEKVEIEGEKALVRKAQDEHELLYLSFMDQGRILADLKSRYDKQAKTLETTEAERKELQRVKDEFEQQCADLSKSLSHVSDKEKYVVEQVVSLQIIKESLQKRVGPLEERSARLSTENAELIAERDGMMKDLKKYLEQVTELEKETKSLIEEKRGFITQVGDLEKGKAELRAEVQALKEQTVSLEANLDDRAKDYSEHIAVLRNEHKTQVENLEAYIAGITNQHQVQAGDLQEQLAGLGGQLDGAREEVKALEASLADEKSKQEGLASANDLLSIDLEGQRIYSVEQEVTIMTLREDLARRSDVIAILQETNKTLQSEQEKLQKLAEQPEVPKATDTPEYKTLLATNEELSIAKTGLEAKNAELEASIASTKADLEAQLAATKTDLEARIAQSEAERAVTRSALAAELAAKSTSSGDASKVSTLEEEAAKVPGLLSAKATLEQEAAKVPVLISEKATLEQEAAKIPTLLSEKAALEQEAAKVPTLLSEKTTLEAKTTELETKTKDLESKTTELEAKASDLEAQATQLPTLRSECAKLAEQLAAANKLIEGLTAVQQAASSSSSFMGTTAAAAATNPPSTPAAVTTPLSPTFPRPPSSVYSEVSSTSTGQDACSKPPRTRSRAPSMAPSMVRSVSSRASSKRSAGARDDIALVMIRNPADRGAVQIVRKCDLRELKSATPRSRSQPPEKE